MSSGSLMKCSLGYTSIYWREGGQRFHLLDSLRSQIADDFSSGLAEDSICRRLSYQTQSASEAAQSIRLVKDALFGEHPSARDSRHLRRRESQKSTDSGADAFRWTIVLGGLNIGVSTSDAPIADALQENFRATLKPTPAVHADHLVRLVRTPQGFQTIVDGRVLHTASDIDAHIDYCHGRLLTLAIRQPRTFLALHGAALYTANRSVVLCGKGGSGKSTLALAMMQRGYACAGDDYLTLTGSGSTLLPVPVPVVSKESGWNTAARYYPGLISQPIHHRKGKDVRYLPIPEHTALVEQQATPHTFIAVSYSDKHGNTPPEKLSPEEFLQLLIETRCEFHSPVTKSYVQNLVAWINNRSVYRLHYNDIDYAISEIETLSGRVEHR